MRLNGANGGRVEVLGCPISAVTMDEAVLSCEEAIAAGGYYQHMSVNAAKLVAMQDDPTLKRMVASCDLVTADGQSVVWASRLLGSRVPERVTGIDLMERLLAAADQTGYRVFILGARPEVLATALENLRERYPNLVFAGSRDGYFADTELLDVCEEIRLARPDMLFVAMSSPRKEYFLGEQGETLGVPFAMGVGGSVDVIAGVTKRAPRLWQRLGLEWAYRLLQEPRRLAHRYFSTNFRFAGMVMRAMLPANRRANRVGAAAASAQLAVAERKEQTDQVA
jgi:N-acetylglucosaminyldiphosphoundecaprenol N-acetyl-beta-D-mannosaminyltransferase